jgi:G3E family GTPase
MFRFPKNTLSLILTLNINNNIIIIIVIVIVIKIPYISANTGDIDTKLSGCVQFPKEHSVRHSDPQHQQQHHHHHHHHRHLHQTTSLLYPCIPYISVTFFESLYHSQNKDNDTKLSGYDP